MGRPKTKTDINLHIELTAAALNFDAHIFTAIGSLKLARVAFAFAFGWSVTLIKKLHLHVFETHREREREGFA